MMTAMNLSHLPPALVRSGRVELRLEMKLPDENARRRILDKHMQGLTGELAGCDTSRVIAATEGFPGADMKRLAEDAKGFFAFDRASKAPLRRATEYYLEAAAGVRENKRGRSRRKRLHMRGHECRREDMKFSIRRGRTPRIEGNKAAASRRTPNDASVVRLTLLYIWRPS
jgi:SpoVK/Ycf46/Vps4 family AAA+-type ATPase